MGMEGVIGQTTNGQLKVRISISARDGKRKDRYKKR